MAFIEKLGPFFNDRDFAVTATFTDVSAGASSSVKGIFDNETELIDIGDVEVEAKSSRFVCAYSDITTAVEDDTFLINGTTFKVAGPIIRDESGNQATIILKD